MAPEQALPDPVTEQEVITFLENIDLKNEVDQIEMLNIVATLERVTALEWLKEFMDSETSDPTVRLCAAKLILRILRSGF